MILSKLITQTFGNFIPDFLIDLFHFGQLKCFILVLYTTLVQTKWIRLNKCCIGHVLQDSCTASHKFVQNKNNTQFHPCLDFQVSEHLMRKISSSQLSLKGCAKLNVLGMPQHTLHTDGDGKIFTNNMRITEFLSSNKINSVKFFNLW